MAINWSGNVRRSPTVAPLVQTRAQLVNGHTNWNTQSIMELTTPNYLKNVRDWTDIQEGEVFSDRDVLNANKVCMVGTTIKREVFDNESPIGKDLRINNVAFRVIGVLSSKGANMMGRDQDDIVLAPWTTIKFRLSSVSANAVASANPTESQTTFLFTVNSLSSAFIRTPRQLLRFDHGRRDGRHPAVGPPGDGRQSAREGRIERTKIQVDSRDQEPVARPFPHQNGHERRRRRPRRQQHSRHDRAHANHDLRPPP